MIRASLTLRASAAAISVALMGTAAAAPPDAAADLKIGEAPGVAAASDGVYQAGVFDGLPLSETPADGVEAGLRRLGLDDPTLATMGPQVLDHFAPAGVRHVEFEQRLSGMRVQGGYVRAAFAADGRLAHMIDRLTRFKSTRLRRPLIGETDALAIATDHVFGPTAPRPAIAAQNGFVSTASDNAYFLRAPTVERVVIADKLGQASVGFLVETWRDSDNMLYHTLIDSVGKVRSVEQRTASDSYRVFLIHPGVGGQVIVNGPNTSTCTGGSAPRWLNSLTQNTNNISGCNVRAYRDADANNLPDAGGSSVTSGAFLATATLTQAPTTTANIAVSVQNLFYQNNIAHDRLYTAGFTEAFRNFQVANGGLGGLGNDVVLAETQDGSGTNNANFATPADGSSPRMQMFLWTAPNPDRDSSLDGDVVYHEYGHGLTWRIVGGMSGNVAGALGEGMSDVIAMLFTNNDAIGEYSFNNTIGIRSQRYSLHTETLANFNASRGVHRNGEIYAATIWRLWTLYQQNGLSVDTLLTDIVSGLKLTPATPTYIQMRDGLLSALPGSRVCLAWTAFAAKGMGEGATMTAAGAVSASSAVPASCTSAPSTSFGVSDASANEGSAAVFTVTRSGATTGTNAVNFATANGSAAAGSDYTAVSGVLSFAPGETAKTVSVPTLADAIVESDETFTLNLSGATGGAGISDGSGQGVIVNSGGSPNLPPVAVSDEMFIAQQSSTQSSFNVVVNVLANDFDPDNSGPLSVVAVSSTAGVTTSIVPPSGVRFTGSYVRGNRLFNVTYTIQDALGAQASAGVTLETEGLCGQFAC